MLSMCLISSFCSQNMNTYIYTYLYIYIYMLTHVFTHVCTCAHNTYMHTGMHIHVYIHMHACTYSHVQCTPAHTMSTCLRTKHTRSWDAMKPTFTVSINLFICLLVGMKTFFNTADIKMWWVSVTWRLPQVLQCPFLDLCCSWGSLWWDTTEAGEVLAT